MSDQIIDRKFRIMAVNPCKMHTLYTEENSILLCAHDAALIPTLKAYKSECEKLGCEPEHLESIDLLIDRVKVYQVNVGVKTADTDTDCEIDRCIGGNLQPKASRHDP